jgi:hypothetical protein
MTPNQVDSARSLTRLQMRLDSIDHCCLRYPSPRTRRPNDSARAERTVEDFVRCMQRQGAGRYRRWGPGRGPPLCYRGKGREWGAPRGWRYGVVVARIGAMGHGDGRRTTVREKLLSSCHEPLDNLAQAFLSTPSNMSDRHALPGRLIRVNIQRGTQASNFSSPFESPYRHRDLAAQADSSSHGSGDHTTQSLRLLRRVGKVRVAMA